eukprot:12400667-Karenia_brevis.AAC.1
MLKKAQRKEITIINPVSLLKHIEQWRILFTEGITTDQWHAFFNTIIYSLSDEVIEQLQQAAMTTPMRAAYDIVCARLKCYKGATRTFHSY